MNSAAWQVQHVAGFQAQLDWRRKPRRIDRFSALHLVRRYVDVVQMPGLGSLDLKDQHVVLVVMGDEAA